MGTGSSSVITSQLDRANLFYFSGDIIGGKVHLNVPEDKLEADAIFMTLTGEIGYTTTHTVSNGKVTSTRTEYHNIPFYTAKIVFVQPEPGQKQIVLSQGQYSWPFAIQLANHLPPTMNEPLAYPRVRYSLLTVIDRPWYKSNTKEVKYLTVYPRINLLQNPQCLLSNIFGNQNRKEIVLRGTLNKLGYVPGETIHLTLNIENPRAVTIQRIDLSMSQAYQIGRNSRGQLIFQSTLPRILNSKDQQIADKYSVKIPSVPLPPSYSYQAPSGTYATVNIHYILKLAVKVEGMFTNFEVEIPMVIGTEPHPLQNQQQTFQPITVSYPSAPQIDDYDSPPPNYDSVVAEMK